MGWKDSTRIFMNTSASGANMTVGVHEFPLLVRLNGTNFDFTKAKGGGADLRFADSDGKILPLEIEHWDATAKAAAVWVRVPVVDPLSTTDYIVMYWNNPDAATASNPQAVFDTTLGYSGVWHFGEVKAGTGAKAVFRDATANANHGDDYASDDRSDAVIAHGQEFDGIDDRISIPNSPSLALGSTISVSAWCKADYLSMVTSPAVVNPILRKGDDNPNSYQFGLNSGKVFLALDADDNGGGWSKTDIALDRFYHVAATFEAKSIKIYVNGVLDQAFTTPSNAISKDARPLHIGGRVPNTEPASRDFWDGDLDEVRISRAVHTPQHYKLSYENQKPGSTMLTFKAFDPPAVPEKLSDWPQSRKLLLNTTSEGAGVAGAVSAFPLLVRLNEDLFPFGEAKADGADLRFSDPDGTFLPFDIERWDAAAKKAEVWVKVPKVDGNSSTDHIRMHWGNAAAAAKENPAAVFDTGDGFTGVWHLAGASSGFVLPGSYADETANRNHGEDHVLAEASEGLIGRGQRFGGKQDYIAVPSSEGLQFQAGFTFSAWVKGAQWDSGSPRISPILRKGGANPNAYQLAIDSGHANLYVNDRDENGTRSSIRLDTGSWYHVAATWKIGIAHVYVNGAVTATVPTGSVPPLKDGRPLFIGGRDTTGGGGDQFTGMLDEIQVSRLVRSEDWMKLAYESQKANARLVWHEGLEGKLPPKDTAILVPPKDTVIIVRPGDTAKVRPPWTFDTTLAAGQELGTPGVFTLKNPGLSPLKVTITPAGDTAGPGVIGVEAIIRLGSGSSDGKAPIAIFIMDTTAAGGRSVYQLLPGVEGHARLGDWGGAAGSTDLYYAGSYIIARDTLPPVIRIREEGITEEDSSWVEAVVEDNIKHVFIKCFAEGTVAEGGISRREHSGIPFRLAFKPKADPVPLKIYLSVDDGRQQTGFPVSPATHHTLARGLSGLSAPLELRSGLEWGLFGLPVRPSKPMTLEALASASGAGRLYAALWTSDDEDTAKGTYRILEAKDTLPAGQGLWLAGEEGFSSLPIGSARSFAQGPASVHRIALRRGWNQIASPSLEKLPWVVSKSDLAAYDQSPVKGLHAYFGAGRYQDADTLEPWKGYFVYSRSDTTLMLSPHRAAPALAKPAGNAGAIRLVLEPQATADGWLPASAALRLGAAGYAEDGIGVEDEYMPGSPLRRPFLAASRQGRGLRTDLVSFREGRLHVWKLAWAGSRERGLPEAARLRLADLVLPEGMELRAAGTFGTGARRVAAGEDVELLGDAADTLVLFAGPAGSWREGDPIPGLAPRPAKLAVAFAPQGAELLLALPEAMSLRATLHTADGRRVAGLERNRLSPGRHALPLSASRNLPRGLLFVTVELEGSLPVRLVLKSVRP